MARKKRRRESPPPAEASAAPADNRSVVAPPRRQRREGPTEQSAREEPVGEGRDSGSATSRWVVTADGLQLQRRASPSEMWTSRHLLPSLPTPPAVVPIQQRMEEKQLLHRQVDIARLTTSGRWHFFSRGVVLLGSSLEPPSAEDLEDLDRDSGADP